MPARVVGAGLLGGAVLIVWTILVDGMFGFRASIDMNRVAEERLVYETLAQHVVEPGRYVVNPQLTPEGRFPAGEPVFSVMFGGMGHEAAGGLALFGLVLFLLAPVIAAWMLSQTSDRVMSSYSRKALFFLAVGVLFAIVADLGDLGIGGYPARDAALLAASRIIAWTLVGLVVAWRLKPSQTRSVA